MIFTKATMSNEKDECDKLTTPHDYYLWRTGAYSIPKKRFTPPDSWWFTVSMNSSEVYLLHVWEREVFKLPHRKTDGSVETYRIKGRIECDCKSFIYSKLTPRCCKHSVQLAREIFGSQTKAHKVVFNARQLDEPDEWCSHLFTVEEEIRLKQRDENRARLVDQRNSLAERIEQHEREQIMKYKLQQKGQWKPNTLGVVYHD